VNLSDGSTRRIAVIVNPRAGLGGRLALKGSDSVEAMADSGSGHAGPRAARALARFAELAARDRLVVEALGAPGQMGADIARAAGLCTVQLHSQVQTRVTTAADTRRAAASARDAGADLILFAGGDGTARDVTGVVGAEVPVLGIPAGVKMRSGVFASTPEAAGETAASYLRSPGVDRVAAAEVVDVDELELRADRSTTRLYGSALVPRSDGRVLRSKASGGAGGYRALPEACAAVARALAPGVVHLIGPGTTTGAVLSELDLAGSLLGVDAICDRRLIGRDLDEQELLEVTDPAVARLPPQLILGVVGGQGMLIGRGNQQLSPDVLRRVGRDRMIVLAAREKLIELRPMVLRIDTGDRALDRELSGHVRVRVGPREMMLMPVGC
jgi:predicted polyphosphate/ATP-dependent NAD kinase